MTSAEIPMAREGHEAGEMVASVTARRDRTDRGAMPLLSCRWQADMRAIRARVSPWRWFAVVMAISLATASVRAAPLQRNLPDGLVYFRIKTLPADLPSDDPGPRHASVIDLRYAKTDDAGAMVLTSWLKFHAAPRAPVFLLVNSATAPALLHALEDRDIPGVLTIGIASARFRPDIPVEASAEKERHAYDALELGTTVRALTTDNPDKIRNDEASLAHDRSADADTSDDDTPDSDKPVPVKPPPLIDRALQRAIQLYKGLKAMKAE